MSNSLRNRLYATVSFMIAGFIPGVFAILYDYVQFGAWASPFSFYLLLFIVPPGVLAAMSGSLFGAAILDPEKVKSAWRAAVRGLIVLLVAWLAYLPLLSSVAGKATNMSFVQKLLLLLIGGSLFIGWLIAAVGIATGLLLFRHRKPSPTAS